MCLGSPSRQFRLHCCDITVYTWCCYIKPRGGVSNAPKFNVTFGTGVHLECSHVTPRWPNETQQGCKWFCRKSFNRLWDPDTSRLPLAEVSLLAAFSSRRLLGSCLASRSLREDEPLVSVGKRCFTCSWCDRDDRGHRWKTRVTGLTGLRERSRAQLLVINQMSASIGE